MIILKILASYLLVGVFMTVLIYGLTAILFILDIREVEKISHQLWESIGKPLKLTLKESMMLLTLVLITLYPAVAITVIKDWNT